MRRRSLSLMLLPLATIGCMEQQDQVLPFEPDPTGVSRTVPVSGGIISTPAGAAVQFPAQWVGSDQSVTLTTQPIPSFVAASGRAISEHAFAVEPAGLRLNVAAEAGVRFNGAAGDSTWLASLVSSSPAGVSEHSDTRVDASAGIAYAPLQTLGTLAVVIPQAGAVFTLKGGTPPPTTGTQSPEGVQRLRSSDSVTVNCGRPGRRCNELSIHASENLLGRVRRAAVVYPVVKGKLVVQNGELVGEVNVNTAIRAELAGGKTAENVRINEAFRFKVALPAPGTAPGANRTVIGAGPEGETVTVNIPETGNPTATVRYRVQVPNSSGVMEPATVAISFPLQVHP